MERIIVRFNFDRWEVIRRCGFHEQLLAWHRTRSEARKTAQEYKQIFREAK